MITLRHTTLVVTPLDELSSRHSDLYLTTHNIHMPPAEFEPPVPASGQSQTHTSKRAELLGFKSLIYLKTA
jgi:hypothetical protein